MFFSLEKKKKFLCTLGFPGGSAGKESACSGEDLDSIPGLEDPLEKGKATHSSVLGKSWEIPWPKIPGRLQSMGSPESDAT